MYRKVTSLSDHDDVMTRRKNHANYSKLDDMNKADLYKERRYLPGTIKHSQTAQQKMKIMRTILVNKKIL